MSKKNLQKQVAKLEAELAKLKEQIADMPDEHDPMEPPFESRETVYTMHSNGHIKESQWYNYLVESYVDNWLRGNVAKTREELERKDKLDRLNAYLKHCKGAREFVNDEANYCLMLEVETGNMMVYQGYCFSTPTVTYFNSEENAQAAWDNMPEDLEQLYKGK